MEDHRWKEDKGVTEMVTPGGTQRVVIINESGLYSLIRNLLRGRKDYLYDELDMSEMSRSL